MGRPVTINERGGMKRKVVIQLTERQATQLEKFLYWAAELFWLIPSKEKRIYREVLRQLNGKSFRRAGE